MKFLADDAARFGSLHYETGLKPIRVCDGAAARLIGATPEEIAMVKNTSEGISDRRTGLSTGSRATAWSRSKRNFRPTTSRGGGSKRAAFEITWLSIYDPIEKIAATVGRRASAGHQLRQLSERLPGGSEGHRRVLPRSTAASFSSMRFRGWAFTRLTCRSACIDALSADGHKWLLGPEGNGILYVRREWQDRIRPVEFGWTNRAHAADYLRATWNSAQRCGPL